MELVIFSIVTIVFFVGFLIFGFMTLGILGVRGLVSDIQGEIIMDNLPNNYDTWRLATPDHYDDNTCIRCEENESEYGEDYCEYCAEVIRNQNRDKFQPRETY